MVRGSAPPPASRYSATRTVSPSARLRWENTTWGTATFSPFCAASL